MAKIILICCLILISLKKCVEPAGAHVISGVFSTNHSNENSAGDKLECEVLKKSEPSKDSWEYYTLSGDYSYFRKISNNCFSFRVRGVHSVHIAMSSVPNNSPDMLEIVIALGANTIMRKRAEITKSVVSTPTPNIINTQEFRGFWVYYTESGLLQLGREGEISPFMSYQHDTTTIVNFIGITTVQSYASWIIDLDPKCPGIKRKSETERLDLQCLNTRTVADKADSLETLVRSQQNILSEIIKLTKNFDITPYNFNSTNLFEVEDFYADLTVLLRKSKLIHEKVIFMNVEDGDLSGLFTKEDSIYGQIKNRIYESFAQKSLINKKAKSNDLSCY